MYLNHQGVMFTGRFWISSAGVGSEFLLFCQTPRWNQCCWSKAHTWRGNVLGGTRPSDEEKRGGAALGPRREISRKAMLGAVVASQCPHFLPIPTWKRLSFSWAVHLLWILEGGNVHCECLHGGRGRKEIAPLCIVTVPSRWQAAFPCDLETAEWASSHLQHLMGQHSRIQCRPEFFFLPVMEVVEECWLKCFEEGKDRGVSSQRVLPPPFLPACQCWVLSCCPLAPQRPPLQGPSCSSSKYLSSPHPNIISSSITSKFSFSPVLG